MVIKDNNPHIDPFTSYVFTQTLEEKESIFSPEESKRETIVYRTYFQ